VSTDPKGWRMVPGQLHSTYAAGSVRVEVRQLIGLLQQLQAAGVDMQQELVTYTLKLLELIQTKTPVDTGRARASWHAVLPNTSQDSFTYSDRQGKKFDGTLPNTGTGPMDTVVGSNVEYMIFLEAGHSKQAPSGMVALSLSELRGALEGRLQAVIAARSKT
jgi:hypothetical protein